MTSRTAAVAAVAAALLLGALAAPAILPAPPPPPLFPAPLDLNAASARQLDLLPSVGPKTAERIVAEREAHGPFRAAADVRRIPGVTRRAAQRIERYATAR